MRKDTILSFFRLAIIGLPLALGGCAAQDGGDEDFDASEQALIADSPLVPRDTPENEQRYFDLAKGWILWAHQQPWSTGPVKDTTGAACALGQSGDTWFLAGTTGGPVERTCTIPANTSLYFPLINFWVMPPASFTDEEQELKHYLQQFSAFFKQLRHETCNLEARLDGEEILPDQEALDEALWVSVLDPFPVQLDADNFSGSSVLVRPHTATNGHYALFEPLSPGEHLLEFGGARCKGDSDHLTFETHATYHLHVE